MAHIEQWIWLSPERYPKHQSTIYSGFLDPDGSYAVAEFTRSYQFDQPVALAELRFSGDTEFRLSLNGEMIATGPISVGGDFLFNDKPRSKHYASELTLRPQTETLDFFAEVKLMPCGIIEYSRGQGGFMLEGKLTMADGSVRYIVTDETWLARHNRAYAPHMNYDARNDTDTFAPAAFVDNRWHCETAPIPLRTEETIVPTNSEITVAAGETVSVFCEFDKIYGGFVTVDAIADGEVDVTVECIETDISLETAKLTFVGNGHYRSFQLKSIGAYQVTVVNRSATNATVKLSLVGTYFPVLGCTDIHTSNADMNLVLDVCRHTLQYCRQMIHLDSPKHSEPLACTGDYYIESLMTAMSFGDMRLAEFDIVRTAELLRMHDGRMFHTSYSLIWVMMLLDVYKFTGNKALLEDCLDALYLLLARFETYMGENGLIETPPDFMFVDWIYIDEISMHHPPKALGQTVLCAYYHGALHAAAQIYAALGLTADAAYSRKKATELRKAVNEQLYDAERGLYFDGLNTPTPEELLYFYQPQNVEKRYYMPHSNILCSLFGVADDDTARRLIRTVVADKEWGVCQPYFRHWLLEAIYRLGLREELTMEVLEDWKAPVKECSKGLVEGFIAPEPTYSFDHSHAWGGTPLYSLPKALLGLEILEPAYKKIRLAPTLLGLESAHIEVPTPHGILTCDLQAGKEPVIDLPKGITLVR